MIEASKSAAKLTKAQIAYLKSCADGSIWNKPARASQRPMESRLIEAGFLKDWKITEAGRDAITKSTRN